MSRSIVTNVGEKNRQDIGWRYRNDPAQRAAEDAALQKSGISRTVLSFFLKHRGLMGVTGGLTKLTYQCHECRDDQPPADLATSFGETVPANDIVVQKADQKAEGDSTANATKSEIPEITHKRKRQSKTKTKTNTNTKTVAPSGIFIGVSTRSSSRKAAAFSHPSDVESPKRQIKRHKQSSA